MDKTASICVLYFYNVTFVMDEFGFNENQLVILLSLSSEQLLHECWLTVFDSAIIAIPQAMQSHT